MSEPTVFRELAMILGESLSWHDGLLWWCDISAGIQHNSAGLERHFAPPLACVQPVLGGGWVASFESSVAFLDSDDDTTTPLAAIQHRRAGIRLNEGKVDPAGRWVTGSMELTHTGDPDCAFYSVTADGTVRTLLGGIGVANGLEWSLDERTIYFTDTSVETIYRASYSEEGDVGEPSVFHTGAPHDGLAIDNEGCFWSAHYGSGVVARYDPDGTEILRVEFPAPNLTSVAFGGDDLSTLFVTSARENLTEEQLRRHPLSGSVFALQTETSGRPPFEFRR